MIFKSLTDLELYGMVLISINNEVTISSRKQSFCVITTNPGILCPLITCSIVLGWAQNYHVFRPQLKGLNETCHVRINHEIDTFAVTFVRLIKHK